MKLVIHGDGAPADVTLAPPFDRGDAKLCLRGVLKAVRFPRFRQREMKVEFPLPLGR